MKRLKNIFKGRTGRTDLGGDNQPPAGSSKLPYQDTPVPWQPYRNEQSQASKESRQSQGLPGQPDLRGDVVLTLRQGGPEYDQGVEYVELQPLYVQNSTEDTLNYMETFWVRDEEKLRTTREKMGLVQKHEDFWDTGLYLPASLPYVWQKRRPHRAPPPIDSISTLDVKLRFGRRESYAEPQIFFQRCAGCSVVFEYSLGDQGSVYIWSRKPVHENYIAASYVWGQVSNISAQCLKCERMTAFPAESVDKFRTIMEAAEPGNYLWIDAISIDQTDEDDINAQLSVMGNIYENASRVVVILPASDVEIFNMMRRISDLGKLLLDRPAFFHLGVETQEMLLQSGGYSTAELCKEYISLIERLPQTLRDTQYFRRGWTFQEWSIAQDIDIAIEWTGTKREKICSVKSSIFSAAALITQFILLKPIVAEGQQFKLPGIQDHQISAWFDMVKRLFPLEKIMLAPSEMNVKESRLQTVTGTMSGKVDLRLGLRTGDRESAPSPSSGSSLPRLEIMLGAFSTRDSPAKTAKFDADLVACWASMCNIPYKYTKTDSLHLAVIKIQSALRNQGIENYAFIPSQLERRDFRDRLSFFHFTYQHVARNSLPPMLYPGLPILNGRCDTQEYISRVLDQDLSTWDEAPYTPLRMVRGVRIVHATRLSNHRVAVGILSEVIYGMPLEFLWDNLVKNLETMPTLSREELTRRYDVAVFHIKVADKPAGEKRDVVIKAWALIPQIESAFRLTDVFVARDNNSGIFMAATKTSKGFVPLSYLVITDQTSGTHLLRSSAEGYVDILFETPRRTDITMAWKGGLQPTDPRRLQGKVDVDRDFLRVQGGKMDLWDIHQCLAEYWVVPADEVDAIMAAQEGK